MGSIAQTLRDELIVRWLMFDISGDRSKRSVPEDVLIDTVEFSFVVRLIVAPTILAPQG